LHCALTKTKQTNSLPQPAKADFDALTEAHLPDEVLVANALACSQLAYDEIPTGTHCNLSPITWARSEVLRPGNLCFILATTPGLNGKPDLNVSFRFGSWLIDCVSTIFFCCRLQGHDNGHVGKLADQLQRLKPHGELPHAGRGRLNAFGLSGRS
jgi:hypothetical protein